MKWKLDIQAALEGRTLEDLGAVWEELSKGMVSANDAYPFRWDRQHSSRASKWIPVAISREYEIGEPPSPELIMSGAKGTALESLLSLMPECIGMDARSAFLVTMHGMTPSFDIQKKLPNDVRKAANNVAESVRRVVKFFQAVAPSRYGLESSGQWPPAAKGKKFAQGMQLYRRIQRLHVRSGIEDPSRSSPNLIKDAAEIYIRIGRERKSLGPYNTMLRQLRNALEEGCLAPLGSEFIACLQNEYVEYDRGEPRILEENEMISRWPGHFLPDPERRGKIDRKTGLLGFFSRDVGGNRPRSPAGMLCPRQNLLSGNPSKTDCWIFADSSIEYVPSGPTGRLESSSRLRKSGRG